MDKIIQEAIRRMVLELGGRKNDTKEAMEAPEMPIDGTLEALTNGDYLR